MFFSFNPGTLQVVKSQQGQGQQTALGSISPLSLVLFEEPEPKSPLLCLFCQLFEDSLQFVAYDTNGICGWRLR